MILAINVSGQNLDTLNTYSITSQTLGANDKAVLTTNRAISGDSIVHNSNSSDVIFTEVGRYLISFNCNVTISSLPVDSIITYLSLNNNKIDGTEVYASPLYLEEIITASATVIIEVNSGDILNLVNQSTTARYISSNIAIVKLS